MSVAGRLKSSYGTVVRRDEQTVGCVLLPAGPQRLWLEILSAIGTASITAVCIIGLALGVTIIVTTLIMAVTHG